MIKHRQKIVPIPFTQEGYNQLLQEREAIFARRPGIVAELKQAREQGDLSENGAYKGAKMSLSSLDARLRHLAHLIRYAQIIKQKNNEVVDLGSTVILQQDERELTYKIVGEHESNSLEGKISAKSPLGRVLLGKKIGEQITFEAPKGKIMYMLKKIT